MNESTLVTQLKNALRAAMSGAVVIKHHDAITAGIPDLSVTWSGTTTWLEVKYANPKLLKRELQHQVMLSLERQGQGSAYYVLYVARSFPHVVVCLPSQLDDRMFTHRNYTGFEHTAVAQFIKQRHRELAEAIRTKTV